MKQQIEELIKEAEERMVEYRKTSLSTDDRIVSNSVIARYCEAKHFLSRLKEITKTPTSNCDFRKKECVNDGQIIDGVWRCNNHL